MQLSAHNFIPICAVLFTVLFCITTGYNVVYFAITTRSGENIITNVRKAGGKGYFQIMVRGYAKASCTHRYYAFIQNNSLQFGTIEGLFIDDNILARDC